MSIIHLSKDFFKEEVVDSQKPVLIDFYANWCAPCKMLSPVVDEIASESDHYKICKVNIDDEPELAQAFNVASIPTLVVLKEGKVTNRAVGVKSKAAIIEMLQG